MITKPGNPFTCFVNGSETKEFTFPEVPNPKLYYLTVQGDFYIPGSLLIPARDMDHAFDLFEEAMIFARDCKIEYMENVTIPMDKDIDKWNTLITALEDRQPGQSRVEFEEYLTVDCHLIEPNHILKVAWSDGDCSLSD